METKVESWNYIKLVQASTQVRKKKHWTAKYVVAFELSPDMENVGEKMKKLTDGRAGCVACSISSLE